MERLRSLIGRENGIDTAARAMHEFARRHDVPLAGVLHLTCADESELECVLALQRSFSEHLLPALKSGEHSAFRLANLGARYEWGAAAIAENHYSTRPARNAFKLMLVKINSHVCAKQAKQGQEFGRMIRYDHESNFCGALTHLLGGGSLPCAGELAEAFSSEGLDRLAVLRGDGGALPETAPFFAALVNARLQARCAMVDIQYRRPESPTLYIVLACVTLNHTARDSELVCGIYHADWRGEELRADYTGLGDDPAAYRVSYENGLLRVSDDGVAVTRPVRDHRDLVLRTWLKNQGLLSGDEAAGGEPVDLIPSLAGSAGPGGDPAGGGEADPRTALEHRLVELARRDPVPAAILLFSSGLAPVHHLHRAHRLARGMAGEAAARRVIGSVRDSVHTMTEEQAREALDRLFG
jgi:hypothetical protein